MTTNKKQKKILFISTNQKWGGSEVMWSKCALKLRGDDLDVNCLLENYEYNPPIFEEFTKRNIDVKRRKITYKKTLGRIASRLTKKPMFFDENHLSEVLLNFCPDLVVFSLGDHLSHQFTKDALLLQKKDIPYVVLVQLATDLKLVSDTASKLLERSYNGALKCFFLCKENLEKTELHIGNFIQNYTFFNSPFSLENLNKKSLDYKNDPSVFYLGMVANLLCLHKGQDLLLQVLSKEKWKNRNLQINIYGNGDNKELLKRICVMYDLESKINFLGHVNEVDAIWEQNHACIFTSRMEGQSLAMLDAISSGRMVITTDVGAASELILDERTGYIIPAATSKFVDETLEKAWANRNNWLEMGIDAKTHLKEIISVDPVDELSEMLMEVLDTDQ